MIRPNLSLLLLVVLATPAQAEVVSATDHGFELSGKAVVKAPPARVYTALGTPARWWSSAHTYSGEARNLSLVLDAGGCFCERIPKFNAIVEHGRVVYAQPGAILRLSAALGPLQSEGATGALSWTMKALPGGGTEIAMRYVVGGFLPSGSKRMAPAVDQVMAEQLKRLADFVDTPSR